MSFPKTPQFDALFNVVAQARNILAGQEFDFLKDQIDRLASGTTTEKNVLLAVEDLEQEAHRRLDLQGSAKILAAIIEARTHLGFDLSHSRSRAAKIRKAAFKTAG